MMGASMLCLTVPGGQAYSLPRHLLNEMAGIGVPSVGGIIGRFNAAFLCLRSAQWRAGEGGRNSRRAHAVRQPEPDRHPIGVGRRESTRREQTIMITSPKGNTPSVRPVSLETLEKRVRRALAPRACALLKTRPGTPDRNELGLYAVVDHKRVCIERDASLEALARYLGVLDDNEAIADTVPEKWLPVTVRIVDERAVTVGHRFSIKAKHVNKSTGAILRDGAVELWRNTDQAACAEILMGLLSGWQHIYDAGGEPIEFNRDNLILLLTNYPQSGKQIADALLDDLAKRGTTHGDL